MNPADGRFRYPFTNCTNCGPPFLLGSLLSTPYDRVNTTMKRFSMCADCAAEYADPADRRFHAEPVACPVCGPRLSMELSDAIAALESGSGFSPSRDLAVFNWLATPIPRGECVPMRYRLRKTP